MGGMVLRSVMGNCACPSPVRGFRGVVHVKRVSGVGEWEIRFRERVGGVRLMWGSLKE